MDVETAFDFRAYLHECKDSGDRGTSNEEATSPWTSLAIRPRSSSVWSNND